MDKDRFVRWQAHTLSQLSTALSVLSVLSLGGLGLCLSLAQQEHFLPKGCYGPLFIGTTVAFLLASFLGIGAAITRLLDFRLTAKKVRAGSIEEPLTFFGTDASGWGKATWRLFWANIVFLLVGVVGLTLVIASVYIERFLGGGA